MKLITSTTILAAMAISTVVAAPVVADNALQAREDGGNVVHTDYIYTQGKGPHKKQRRQNGDPDVADVADHAVQAREDPGEGDNVARDAYIYTQGKPPHKKLRRENPAVEARDAYIYTQKNRGDGPDVESRDAYIYTQKRRGDGPDVESRDAYIYTQKRRGDGLDVKARDAYIYTQKKNRVDSGYANDQGRKLRRQNERRSDGDKAKVRRDPDGEEGGGDTGIGKV